MAKPEDEEIADAEDLRHRLHQRLGDTEAIHQGLRERKKALMRQLISDTATLMFLERGFDEVRISEVAAACDVSEKTIYNYFPTKESLLLDREESTTSAIRKALGPDAVSVSPIDAMVGILKDELDELVAHLDGAKDFTYPQILHFNELIERTPALKAARADMAERFARVAAELMAVRAGVDPDDPEPQIAADALVSLWQIFYRSIVKYSDRGMSPEELREHVLGDVRRAARLLDTGLWSFASLVQGSSGREQMRAAAEASNEARKQVLATMKQARTAWRALKTEIDGRSHQGAAGARASRDEARAARERVQEEMRAARQRVHQEARAARDRAHRDARDEAAELGRQARLMAQEIKEAAQRARRSARPDSN